MLELSNGTYSLSFAIYLFLGIVIRFVPDVFPQFQRQNPGGSYPIANFNLPFEVTEQNWPRVRRVGSGIFFAFFVVGLASVFLYDGWLYDIVPWKYSEMAGWIFCACICVFLIGTALATKKKKG